jgi:hypothetical protein
MPNKLAQKPQKIKPVAKKATRSGVYRTDDPQRLVVESGNRERFDQLLSDAVLGVNSNVRGDKR